MKPLPLLISPDLRFTCHGCGDCCREYVVALEPGEAARIARHDWRREGARFAEGFAQPGTGLRGEPREELRRLEGACVFLDADGLCLVEKRLGREAKPKTCRKFPFEFVAAPDGRRVVVSVECGSRWRSLAGGAPVEALRAELTALDAISEPYRTRWAVQVATGGPLLPGADYLALERALAAELRPERPLEATLAGLALVIARAAGRDGRAAAGAAARAVEPFPEVLAVALEAVAEVAVHRRRELAEAVAVLALDPPGGWRSALAAAEATAAARDFLLAVLRTWLDAAIPGRAPSAEDGVGQMVLGTILAAAIGGGSDLARLNAGAREVSGLFRGRDGKLLRELAGGYAPVSRALAASAAGSAGASATGTSAGAPRNG